jgi:hypothetical protein
MTRFQNLILLTNHYGNLQEMLEMAYFLKYVDLYLTSEWGRFYVGHSVVVEALNVLSGLEIRLLHAFCWRTVTNYFLKE